MIILDLGQGDSTQNDADYVRELIDSIPTSDVVLKFQLFEDIPGLTPLEHNVFEFAYDYSRFKGLECTASVFDSPSIDFLQRYDVPFIKIACNTKWYPLIDDIDGRVPLIVSIDSHIQLLSVATTHSEHYIGYISCVPNYPATYEEYRANFSKDMLYRGISDHTTDLELYREFKPAIWERHYAIDDIGPDAAHSIGPDEIREVLGIEAAYAG